MKFRRVFVLLLVLATLLLVAGPVQSATPGTVIANYEDNRSSLAAESGKEMDKIGTLAPIAARIGTSVQAMLSMNKLYNPGVVFTGQRFLTPSGNASPTPPPTTGKWIDVDIGSQTVTAYQGNAPLKIVLVSTGTAWRPTPTGSFKVYRQVPSQTLSGGIGADRYYYPGVPWIMYFSGEVGFHGTYWHNNFGVPMSHGCVNLSIEDAKWFYNWGEVGMPVVVHR